MDDGDKQQETTATTTATRVIHEAAQARDGAERDRGQAGGLGTAVLLTGVWTKCETSKVRFVEDVNWK
jgi:hypothetical protein